MAAREEIVLVISKLIEEETRRNLLDTVPQVADYFNRFLEAVPFEYVRPTRQEIIEATNYVTLKDAPIVAAAKKAHAELLVTLDKKHLLGKPELASYAGMKIVTPKEAMEVLSSGKISKDKSPSFLCTVLLFFQSLRFLQYFHQSRDPTTFQKFLLLDLETA